MFYFVKTPWLLRKLYPGCLWRMPVERNEKIIYLTFDDGPHPLATPYVLDELKKYDARATFFCIGKNVAAHGDIYERILREGHTTGNHTYNHVNGWKTPDNKYLQDIIDTTKYVDSTLFRPPYGRITHFQVKLLTGIAAYGNLERKFRIVMWDVLSGDFDTRIDAARCTLNVVQQTRPGSIVMFHDSEKAFPRMKEALPKMLQYFSEKGYRFEAISA